MVNQQKLAGQVGAYPGSLQRRGSILERLSITALSPLASGR